MSNRYEAVHDAHPTTFDWVFDNPVSLNPSCNDLGEWLESGSGIYWVSGKPGSGKSTLMKYIYDDPRTFACLGKWSGNDSSSSASLCLASFFFWNSGTPEQKSQLGMLRSIIFQILNHYPDLSPVLFPTIWSKHYHRAQNHLPPVVWEQWSLRQLMLAFKILLEQHTVHIDLCLLIDGLDEFEGDHEEIATILCNIPENHASNIKVCLSSRPWPVFREKFYDCPTLRLQTLTYNDIHVYVTDKFLNNNAFKKLSCRDISALDLISEIATKADGVFLWVHLVVKDVLRGIRNLDKMSQLRKMINATPRDLEPLFDHLINEIDPIYLLWASKAFQIERTARELAGSKFLPRPTELQAFIEMGSAVTSTDDMPSEDYGIEWLDCEASTNDITEIWWTKDNLRINKEGKWAKRSPLNMHIIEALEGVSRSGSIGALEFYEAIEEELDYEDALKWIDSSESVSCCSAM